MAGTTSFPRVAVKTFDSPTIMTTKTKDLESTLRRSRSAAQAMAVMATDRKNKALRRLAGLIEARQDFLLSENARDLDEQRDRISQSLYQRLVLSESKLSGLIQGILDVCNLEDPVGRVISRTELDEGLTLDKETVPIGVVGIIFESRPDVVPQILSLILKSGNAVVLKGGSEAVHSNRAFLSVVDELNRHCPWLPLGWAVQLDSREDVWEMLRHPEFLDLVIPRGSNQLVRSIMDASQVPVLGHTEGVCHLYVDAEADLEKAVELAVDGKAQYPSACNSIETLLVDRSLADRYLPRVKKALDAVEVELRGCPETCELLPGIQEATEDDWTTEYGDLTLAIRVIGGLDEAVDHINSHGSHHTDAIVSENPATRERFLAAVDSASVFANASTRFADGFRFGLGAEIGISTARTHARGPVGLEGLVIYKYKLRGDGQIVAEYSGPEAKPFRHRALAADNEP